MSINVVVDLSHHNRISSFDDIKGDGILGIIHKATQGFRFMDRKYADRRSRALDAGLMWGAYHFASGGDGVAQAQHFLNMVKPEAHDLLVLDFEPNPNGSTMAVDEAEDFVEFIFEETGRWPGLYSGQSFIHNTLGNRTDTILSNCWLWIARYSRRLPRVPAAWHIWTMWQYTDGSVGPGPHMVAGIGGCDRDKFNGDLNGLNRLWGI